MGWKRIISTCAASAFFLVSFHVAVGHAGPDFYSSRLGTDANVAHSHGAFDPAHEHDPDRHDPVDHDHFGTFLKPGHTHASDLFLIFQAACLPPLEMQPTEGVLLSDNLPQLSGSGPPLFLRNRSLRL